MATIIILHNLDDDQVAVNLDQLVAAKRREPDKNSMIQEAYTKLYFTNKDKTIEGMGFPDSVIETPEEIAHLAKK